MGGIGDGNVRLAGAGGADAEHEVRLLQRPHVAALHRRARLDDAAARGDLRLTVARDAFLAGVADEAVEVAGADRLAGGSALIKLLQHVARDVQRALRPVERNDVAVRVRLDAETVLDQRQVAVVLAEKLRQMAVVLKGDDNTLVRDLSFGSSARPGDGASAKCCQSALQTSFAANRHSSCLTYHNASGSYGRGPAARK